MKKIVVVGLGALGSHFILFGRNLPAEFMGIDFDRIEQKNLSSQFHTKMGLNRNKAQSLQQAMKGLFGVNIKISPHRLVENNVEQLLGDADVIVDCLDNGASRCVVQTFARDKGVECLHGALAADGQLGRVIWDERFEIDYEDTEGQATCEDGEFLPLIVDTASAMVRCLQDFLKNGRKIGVHIVSYGKIVI